DVTVVTPAVSAWRSVERGAAVARELEAASIRCIRTGHRWRNLSPYDLACRDSGLAWMWGGICRRSLRSLRVEPQVGWLEEAERACAALVPDDVDLVLATGPPFIGFRLAAQIARRLDRPYVLDYRDLWTLNPHAKNMAWGTAIPLEGQLIAGAAAVTVVSEQLAASLRERFGVGDKICVVTNGYDPQDLERAVPRDFGHFAIVYTGQFYPPKRVIEPLLHVLIRLKDVQRLGREWRFHYFGPHGSHVRAAMKGKGLDKDVVVHGSVTRADALAAVAGAGVCVVITSIYETGTREDLGVVTGKVFEAIGLRKPVLAIAPPGSDLERVLATSGFGRCFSGTEIEPMARYLAELAEGHRAPVREPDRYSWPSVGEAVDRVLRRVAFRGESREPVAAHARGEGAAMGSPGR
ncbi:MAG TPA: glycosyltransferase, partial [Thermoanaerobaculia bacterium]|nr:glycosyltransferase [Thermoanaerobaculia bacterium]